MADRHPEQIGGAVPPVLAAAHEARDRLVSAVVALPDEALRGVGSSPGAPRPPAAALHDLIAADMTCRLVLAETLAGLGWDPPAAVRHLQWAPVARARLEASLAGVPDALMDGRPFAGEWTVREQLAHVELTDIRYGIASRHAAARSDDEPLLPPSSAYPPRDDNPGGTPGEQLATILARMRRVREEAIAPLIGLSAEQLLRPTEWHTAEHTLGFRLHRFAQHDLELATDIRRTLAALRHTPTPAIRFAAALVEGWGEIEMTLLGVPGSYLNARTHEGGESPAGQIEQHSASGRATVEVVQRARR